MGLVGSAADDRSDPDDKHVSAGDCRALSILVAPYSLETIDQNRFGTADDFARCMIDGFDLCTRKAPSSPIAGRRPPRPSDRPPARAPGLIKFLDHARRRDRPWFCAGRDIAEHWRQTYLPMA
jgi:hypothetical protein